jgi:DNA polymerase-3 subunit gamma/tau
VDVAALRRAWPDILERVKHENRVAWMLLMDSVEIVSLDSQVLTLAFGKEGNRRGFSGKDAVLRKVLHDMYGVDWRIDTVLDNGGGGRSTPAPPAAGPGPSGRAAPVPSAREADGPADARAADGGSNTGENASADWVVAPVPASPPQEESEPTGVTAPPAKPAAPPTEPAPSRSAPPPASSAPSQAKPAPAAAVPAPSVPPEEDTDVDPLGDGPGAGGGLSGMAVIERELGGRVIHEFDAS